MRVPSTVRLAALLVGAGLPGWASARVAMLDPATDIYVREAKRGNAGAQRTLAFLAAEGGLAAPDAAAAIPSLLRFASSGDLDAEIMLAELYCAGRGIERDLPAAAVWYGRAASGSAYAAWRLGRMFEASEGVVYDGEQAARLYRQAAEAGSAAAQNSLGNLYVAGIGVPQDYKAAREWYRKSADNGYGDALLNLAGLYYQGLGVGRDYGKAFALARRAAELHARDAAPFLTEIERKIAETKKPAPRERSGLRENGRD